MVAPPLSLDESQAMDYDSLRLLGRAEVGLMPRGQRVPPVVPEYAALKRLLLEPPQLAGLGPAGTNTTAALPGVPTGSRILGRQVKIGVEGSTELLTGSSEQVLFGIQWTPQEFVDRAKLAVHPADQPVILQDELADVVRAPDQGPRSSGQAQG